MTLRRPTPERLGAFSDGVFAAIITIMVLELKPPPQPSFAALLPLWPMGLSYAVSYLFIAIVWVNHHHLLRLAGDTVILRPSPFAPLTVLRISDYIRELLPPGVFNVVTGGRDPGLWVTSHSGIDLITFTGSINTGKRILESAAGPLKPLTLEAEGNDSKAVAGADPKNVAIFGSITIVPVNWKPGRHGLARTLFEILSFWPVRMRTQVLVWSLARKASYTFPIFR